MRRRPPKLSFSRGDHPRVRPGGYLRAGSRSGDRLGRQRRAAARPSDPKAVRALFQTPIRNHLKAGEALYKPFSGSGTALIAAERTGTRCYAMEIDPLYAEVALDRWERFAGQPAVRLDG